MYYKRYEIINDDNYKDINILRFSYNPYNNNDNDDSRVKKLLNDLKEQAIKDELSYNCIYPWNDVDLSVDYKNREIIIAYNTNSNHIQGWCNINYNTFSIETEPTNLYNLIVDKLVSREIPKIKYIGLLLLEFIRDECVNKPILYYYNNPIIGSKFETYGKINIDIMYLYSLTPSIDYYKKTFLIQLNNEILDHVFIYINKKNIGIIRKRVKTYISKLNDLHLFECNSILSPKSIMIYNKYKHCKKSKDNNKKIDLFINNNNDIYYINERVYGKRDKNKKIKIS